MLTEDLAKLKELDPTTYNKITIGISISPYKETYIAFRMLPHEIQAAWLQWCLQEAIVARGWASYQINNPGLPKEHHYADILLDPITEERYDAFADTPAAALLACYIAALEAQP